MANAPFINVYFDDPRLRMTALGRLLVRAVGSVGALFVALTAITLAISELAMLRGIGLLLFFYIADRLVHVREGDTPISELKAPDAVNVSRSMTPRAFSALSRVADAGFFKQRSVYLELARDLLDVSTVAASLRRLDVQPAEFMHKLEELARGRESKKETRADIRRQINEIAIVAFERALHSGHEFVGRDHLFSALAFVEDHDIQRLFTAFSIDPGDMDQVLFWSRESAAHRFLRRLPYSIGGFILQKHRGLRHRIMNRAWTARPTRTLDAYSTDITDSARRGEVGFMIGHGAEYERLMDGISRPINPNVVLVGEMGVGKSTIVEHLASAITKDRVPPPLFDKRLVALHISALVSGAKAGDVEGRLEKIAEEIITAGNIILYIPDIHNLVRTSGASYLSAADALMPIIMSGDFPVIGVTYPREYKHILETRSDFAGLFEAIHVQEIDARSAERLLMYHSILLEREHRIVFSFGAVRAAVRIAKKYFHERVLPGSALELLKDALVEAARRGEKTVQASAIIRAAERKTDIPIHEAKEEESADLLNLEETIHKKFVGQDEAVIAVSDAVREYRSGLSRKKGPIASFLFVGPTGVGKTELAKKLAEIQFGSEHSMVRFDMSEYSDTKSLYRFIGAPDGSVMGSLTEAIREKPHSLILLDEFEKSHTDVLNLFLQILDDGRATDNVGRVVDFTNTIIIATSNAHAEILLDALRHGQSVSSVTEYLKSKLADVFKPELINRFSKIVVFRELSVSEMKSVARLNLDEFIASVAGQGITVRYNEDVVSYLARAGYEPAWGARPLRRLMEEKIRSPLAKKILSKEIARGDEVRMSESSGVIAFTRTT